MSLELYRWLCRKSAVLAAALLLVLPPAQAADTLIFIHTDVAGTVIGATDEAGKLIWRENYRPYGERTVNQAAASDNRQFFHGKAFDADTGLSYFGARYYDPVVGRFMGVDAIGFNEENPNSFNRYAYGNNNPYRFRDLDGNAAFLIFLVPIVQGAVTGAVTAGGAAFMADVASQWAAFGALSDVSGKGAWQEAKPAAVAGGLGGAIGGGAIVATSLRRAHQVSYYLARDEARHALSGELGASANQFFRGATSKSRDFRISETEGGGKRFEFFSPARTEGHGKRYVQDVDSKGKVVQEFKDTVGPSGLLDRTWIHGGPVQ
jgi:RHS repeat-associated protein